MAFRFVLLVLPALVLAKIEVDLSGEFTGPDSNLNIYFSGDEVDIISDTERNTFGINDDGLKNAVRAYFGQRPDDVYVRSPTPWGDLYKIYGWEQVTRTLRPRAGKILKISSQPTVVLQQSFENNSSKPATFNVGISQEVQNTVSNSWSTGGEFTIGHTISYGIDIEVLKVGGETSFSYTSSWGENTEHSKTITVGATSSMEIVLEPGQAVIAQLQATRGSIKVEMEYEVSISGQTAVNYAKTYKGHHFWALRIDGCMDSAGLSNRKVSREVIEIGFYSDSKVIVHDKNYKRKFMEVTF